MHHITTAMSTADLVIFIGIFASLNIIKILVLVWLVHPTWDNLDCFPFCYVFLKPQQNAQMNMIVQSTSVFSPANIFGAYFGINNVAKKRAYIEIKALKAMCFYKAGENTDFTQHFVYKTRFPKRQPG